MPFARPDRWSGVICCIHSSHVVSPAAFGHTVAGNTNDPQAATRIANAAAHLKTAIRAHSDERADRTRLDWCRA
jgi:hypothetical protein